MATKTISITEDAYKRLANLKNENESFSMVIERVTGKVKLDNFFGVLSRKSADQLEKAIKEGRKEHRKLREKRLKRLMKEFA